LRFPGSRRHAAEDHLEVFHGRAALDQVAIVLRIIYRPGDVVAGEGADGVLLLPY
jgi:hypothetical protein